MTAEQKFLKEHFLEPETRCDTFISADRKKHWKILLDMLEEVLTVCQRHGLTVWLGAGSILGAIRHKGIIPWDDDIDVIMPRKDYDEFCRFAPCEISQSYVLTTQYNDPASPDPFAKLRKKHTAGILKDVALEGRVCNMSIFIDIFPLDRVPRSHKIRTRRLWLSTAINKARSYRYESDRIRDSLHMSRMRILTHKIIGRLFSLVGSRILSRIADTRFAKYANDDSCPLSQAPVWWQIVTRGENMDKWTYPSECFSGTVNVPFEYLQVPIPIGYEQILCHTYGDWRKFVKGESFHENLFVDTERDYREILIEQFGYRIDDFSQNGVKSGNV